MKLRENLALIADVATIAGVSFAWLMSKTIFDYIFDGNFDLFDIFNALLFAFLVVFACCCLLLLLYNAVKNIIKKDYSQSIILFVTFLVCSSISTGAYPHLKRVWANISFNELLLPAKPDQIISKVHIKINDQQNISGDIELKKDYKPNPRDYVVHVYVKHSDDANYQRFSGSEFKIGHDMSFVASKISKTSETARRDLQGVIVVVARDLENMFRDRVPRKISGTNSIELKEIGAYTQFVDIY